MRCEVVPSEVSDVMPFTPSPFVRHVPEDAKGPCGRISKNGLWMWMMQGPVIEIYRTEGKERRGGYCFTDSSKKPLSITASAELQSSHISFPCLLIALNNDPDGSLLCLFNANALKVVRVLRLPYRITSMEIVSENGGACKETQQLNLPLRYMFGLVAVGTESGHVFLVDLCLDENYDSDITSPNKSVFVTKQTFSAKKREVAIAKYQHLCMVMNDGSFNGDLFEFRSNSSVLANYPSDDVFISSLKYIRSLATIAVGFNFGGVQLWNLQQLTLQTTIDTLSKKPVVSFAFQEPENDPRNYCYLWVIKGHHQQEKPEKITLATLYSLSYHRREWLTSFGPFYTELQSCNKRFEYPLSADPFLPVLESDTFNSRLVSCQVISQSDTYNVFSSGAVSHGESDCSSEDLSLCFICWEAWSKNGNSLSTSYLLVFDINQWYQAHMPSFFRCSTTELCSYLGVFFLQRISQKLNMRSLLGAYALPHSVKKFKCLNSAEEFFYPSSVGFQMLCFSAKGLTEATFFGFQRQLLFELIDDGPKYLVNPKEIFTLSLISGLLSEMHNLEEGNISLISQREALMQLALENNMHNFFMSCMKEFRYSDGMVQEGCSSRSLLNWTWRKVISVKNSIDKLSQPLFNCVGVDIDKASLKQLYSYKKQLDLIDSIFVGYQKYATPRTEQEMQEIQVKRDAIFAINMYLQVLLWLHSNHFLPEVCEGDERDETVTYPVSTLKKIYSSFRSELQKIHSSIGTTDLLLVDGFVAVAGIGSIWQEKGGHDTYPPPSMYAALSCYLVDNISLMQKHQLMYYLLLDIISMLPEQQISLIAEVKRFLQVFDFPHSMAKLTKAFWYLDHQHFESAIKKLLEPGLDVADILPWQHRRIIKAFLFQGEPHKALRYINHMKPPEIGIEDQKLHLSVLLARGLITRAFDFQRDRQDAPDSEELFNHFLLGCQDTRTMKVLVYLPLNTFEISLMMAFLENNEDPRAQETLVMYHLLHYNFFEAARVNEKLLSCPKERCVSTRDRAPYRNALVESFLDTIPKAEKKLAEELRHIPMEISKPESFPQPLSVNITNRSLKQFSYSDMLSSVLSLMSCSRQGAYSQPQTPLKPRSQACYDNIPFLRPAITPEVQRRPSEIMNVTPLPKRNLSSHTLNEFTIPQKKSRLLDSPFKNTESTKKRTPKHLARDIASLLQTPPIHRRSSQSFNKSSLRSATVGTPHSILKKYTRPSLADEVNPYTAKTPSVCSLDSDNEISFVDDNVAEEMQVDVESHSRQIRFEVPSPSESKAESIQTQPSSSDKVRVCFGSFANFSTPHLSGHSLQNEPTETSPIFKQMPRVSHEESFTIQSRNSLSVEATEFTAQGDRASPFQSVASSTVLPYETTQSTRLLTEHQVESSSSQSSESLTPKPAGSSVEQSVSFAGLPEALGSRAAEKISSHQDSFSGSSSYSSASERSFEVTPRRPIRDPNLLMSGNLESSKSVHSTPFTTTFTSCAAHSTTTFQLPLSTFKDSVPSLQQDATKQLLSESKTKSMMDSSKLMSRNLESSSTDRLNLFTTEMPSLTARTPSPILRSPFQDVLPTLQPNPSVKPQFQSEINFDMTEDDYNLTDEFISIRSLDQTGLAERCRNRLEFMSEHSDLYESKKLLEETDRVLEESRKETSNIEIMRVKKQRTYVFSKRIIPPQERTVEKKDNTHVESLDKSVSRSEQADEVTMTAARAEFLQGCGDETYEEFSQSLKKDATTSVGVSKDETLTAETVRTESSPAFRSPISHGTENAQASKMGTDEFKTPVEELAEERFSVQTQRESLSTTKLPGIEEYKTPATKILSKPQTKSTKTKKAKRTKVSQKLEYSFAEPYSPAGPEILEALSSPPERPVLPFVFSPPATRARVRQKKMDETLGSSFSSFISEKSFSKPTKPPVDPLLQEIMEQSSLDIGVTSKPSSSQSFKRSSVKKTSVKKSKSSTRQSMINVLTPSKLVETTETTQQLSPTSRHTMVLRKTVKKKKSVRLL